MYNNAVKDVGFVYRRRIKINGVIFESINAAARKLCPLGALNESETNIRRKLKNPFIINYEIIETVQQGYSTISVDGRIYSSIQSVVEAGLATDRHQVIRRLNSKTKKWQTWFYIQRANKNPELKKAK